MIEYSMLRIHTDSWMKFRKIAFDRRTTITKLFNEVVDNLEAQQDRPPQNTKKPNTEQSVQG
jgi:hypothetical protein